MQVFDTRGAHARTVGSYGQGDSDLARPVDVAFGADGALIVTDGDHHAVKVFAPDGTFRTSFGEWGFFPGLFSSPSGVEARDGRVFVTDMENHRVQVFDTGGELIYRFGLHAIRPREGKGKLHYPVDIALTADRSRAAVVEPYDDRVQVFGRAPGAEPVEDIGATPQASPHFGMQIASSGQLMTLVEPETHQVMVYDLRLDDPARIGWFGGYGRQLGLFRRPTGTSVDQASMSVLTCDSANRLLHLTRLEVDLSQPLKQIPEIATHVKMLDFARLGADELGERLEFAIEPIAVLHGPDDSVFVLDGRNELVLVFDAGFRLVRSFAGHGTEPGKLRRPTEMALSPDGATLYVVDSHNRRVQAFRTNGEHVATFGEEALAEPYGIAVAPDGAVFVTDVRRHRVLRFVDRELVGAWGERGIQRLHFLKPRGLAFDGDLLMVIDHANHRGIVLTTEGEYAHYFGSRFFTKPVRAPHTYKPEDYAE